MPVSIYLLIYQVLYRLMKKQQKLSNISLIVITIAMTGIFSFPNTISNISAQNTSTNSIDVQSVKDLLDQAVESLNNGDTMVALQQLDKAEDSLDVAEDKIEVMLGSNQ
jgi:hypothetical protein